MCVVHIIPMNEIPFSSLSLSLFHIHTHTHTRTHTRHYFANKQSLLFSFPLTFCVVSLSSTHFFFYCSRHSVIRVQNTFPRTEHSFCCVSVELGSKREATHTIQTQKHTHTHTTHTIHIIIKRKRNKTTHTTHDGYNKHSCKE